MALGDYILCCKCEVKLIYDGDRNQREWWEERFGKPPEIECPDCKTPQRQPEQTNVTTSDTSQERVDETVKQRHEPVAWMFQHEETGRMNYVSNDGMNTPELFLKMNPRYVFVCALYTTPPQRQPLTVEQIEYAFRTNSVMVDNGNAYMVAGKRAINIIRAIEAAHGIKE